MSIISPSASLVVYAERAHAEAVMPRDGQHVIVSAGEKAHKDSGREAWERFAVVPSWAAAVADAGEWSAILSMVLRDAASDALKEACKPATVGGMIPSTVRADLFTVQALKDRAALALAGGFTVEELERAFLVSTTWQTIINGEKYKASEMARTQAGLFKTRILALAGRGLGNIPETDLDVIQARLADADLSTPFGLFIIKQVQKARETRPAQGLVADAF